MIYVLSHIWGLPRIYTKLVDVVAMLWVLYLEISDWNVDWSSSYPDWAFPPSTVTPDECQDSSFKQTTAISLQILTYSCFSFCLIQCHVTYVVKRIILKSLIITQIFIYVIPFWGYYSNGTWCIYICTIKNLLWWVILQACIHIICLSAGKGNYTSACCSKGRAGVTSRAVGGVWSRSWGWRQSKENTCWLC